MPLISIDPRSYSGVVKLSHLYTKTLFVHDVVSEQRTYAGVITGEYSLQIKFDGNTMQVLHSDGFRERCSGSYKRTPDMQPRS
jgi:hypothetical protein